MNVLRSFMAEISQPVEISQTWLISTAMI